MKVLNQEQLFNTYNLLVLGDKHPETVMHQDDFHLWNRCFASPLFKAHPIKTIHMKVSVEVGTVFFVRGELVESCPIIFEE